MTVGSFRIKRHYMVAQVVLDIASAFLLVTIIVTTAQFFLDVEQMKRYIGGIGPQKTLPVLVWSILALAVVTVSLILTYKSRKLPKKYKIIDSNAQQYYDILITAISAIRLLALLAIFDLFYMHQQYVLLFSTNFWNVKIPCDALLIFIIIRFSIHRIHAIEPKPEKKKEKEIVEI